ncbi:zinc-ribbon domain-containing protein [Candidatus Gracilibacteria bacterium]|nr:zinc-ribbon domain-containing protein [Candidatus Gracilibacteria bacterium]
MRCIHCQADVPDEAQFCIECGAELRTAATGVTTQLPQPTVFPKRCPTCGAGNPEAADFCMICAQPLGARSCRLRPQAAGLP